MLLSATWSLEGVSGNSYIGWIFLSEFIGSFLLILLGNGVVAAVNLKGSKAKGAGWTAIAIGWAVAVFIGAITSQYSGAHLNFAVTLGLLIESFAPNAGPNIFGGGHEWLVVIYLLAQFAGMFIAQLVVDAVYYLQIKQQGTDDFLCIHCTEPAQKERTHLTYFLNFLTEAVGTFVLLIAVSAAGFYGKKLWGGDINGLTGSSIAAMAVLAIGYGLGGPTGFAINPTRDLAPRIVYQILPLPNKGKADWAYSWVPVVGPIVGGLLGGAVSIGFLMA